MSQPNTKESGNRIRFFGTGCHIPWMSPAGAADLLCFSHLAKEDLMSCRFCWHWQMILGELEPRCTYRKPKRRLKTPTLRSSSCNFRVSGNCTLDKRILCTLGIMPLGRKKMLGNEVTVIHEPA